MPRVEEFNRTIKFVVHSDHPKIGLEGGYFQRERSSLEDALNFRAFLLSEGYHARIVLLVITETEYEIQPR